MARTKQDDIVPERGRNHPTVQSNVFLGHFGHSSSADFEKSNRGGLIDYIEMWNSLLFKVLVQFIRIAKRLHEYSNYHGMLALVSALRHVSIARLTDTWERVSRRDKQNFESLVKFVPEDEGHQRLRETFEKIQLPCIPHLGIFLKELIYIDVAHPDNGGLESEGRMLKMNNILRLIR